MPSDQSRGPKRSTAKFQEYRKKNRKLGDMKYDEMSPRTLSRDADGQESPADRELRKMQNNDKVRSRPGQDSREETNPRRYK